MLRPRSPIIPALFGLFLAFFLSLSPTQQAFATEKVANASQDGAADSSAPQLPPVETIKTTLIAEIDSTVIVTLDGTTLDDTYLHRGEDGELYIDALPIFETLGNQVDFDAEKKALIVRRSQDGVVMELHTETGIVSANGKKLGALPVFGAVRPDDIRLTPNAIAVLSGASGKLDSENNRFDFELDPRLRVATGFDLIVDGVPIGQISPEPKSVGPILLLPLRPIAEALGHRVTVLDGGSAVRVERAQDSAVFTLDLDTGVVSLYERPIGVSEDASYIDPVQLLLPVGVFETLTGTHVTSGESGTIQIDLDTRLGEAVGPDGTVEDLAADTPFELEYTRFEIGSDSTNVVAIGAHSGRFNGALRVELGETPRTLAELEPDWVSVDFQHISGTNGRIGDIATSYRELDGVGIRRLRGLSLEGETDEGRWAFAVGTPAASRRQISDRQTRQDFEGLVAGARYAANAGWEAGLSLRHDPASDDQMAVLSAISGRLGRKSQQKTQWDGAIDVGVFNGPSRSQPVDVRMRGQLRREITETIRLDASASYSGAEFTRTLLRAEDIERLNALREAELDGLDDEEDTATTLPDVRAFGQDTASLSVGLSAYNSKTYGPFDGFGSSVRVGHDRSGIITGTSRQQAVSTLSLSGTSRIAALDTSITAGASVYTGFAAETSQDRFNSVLSDPDESDSEPSTSISGSTLYATAFRDFKHAALRARVEVNDTSATEAITTASVTATSPNYGFDLPKAAHVTLRPSVTASYQNADWQVRGGMFAGLDSGEWLGPKTKVNASLGIIQSASGRSGARTSRFLNMSVARQVKLGDNMSVGLGYQADLRGEHDLRLILRGRYDHNPQRRLRKTKDDAGLLQGQAFIDTNGDGIRQDDERGAGGVIVRVQGTPFALRTDASGSYTVHNIGRGLYQVGVDNRSLPLGYGMKDSATKAVTVRPGHVTTLDLPIQRFGQIRGSVFVDADASGTFERGETRPEGVTLELLDADGERVAITASTSFGQFAFDSLPIGQYTLKTVPRPGGGMPFSTSVSEPLTIDLGEESQGMARIRVPIGQGGVRSVEATSETPIAPEDAPQSQQTTGLPPP